MGSYYFLFTAAVYHAVPWEFVAEEALDERHHGTGPDELPVATAGWGVAIVLGAAIALINDLPAMLLSVSRLMFAWAEDGIFPRWIARVHPQHHTPQTAILLSGVMASIGILGSHFAGDFFLGIDIMVTSMLVNFLLMCLTVLALPKRNPALHGQVKVLRRTEPGRLLLAGLGVVMLTGFLIIHVVKDLRAETSRLVLSFDTGMAHRHGAGHGDLPVRELQKLKAEGVDTEANCSAGCLPNE